MNITIIIDNILGLSKEKDGKLIENIVKVVSSREEDSTDADSEAKYKRRTYQSLRGI